MTFKPIVVLDRTMQTDSRVHGPKMKAGDPQGILIHATGSTNEAGDESWLSKYHANPVSINQLVKRSGVIVQIVPQDVIAWHAGTSLWAGRSNCNNWQIGIEVCNSNTGREKYTDAQYESIAQTVAYNTARFHIADRNVTSHARVAIPKGRKDDPKGLDWARVWNRVDQLRQSWPYGIPLWFDATGTRVMST